MVVRDGKATRFGCARQYLHAEKFQYYAHRAVRTGFHGIRRWVWACERKVEEFCLSTKGAEERRITDARTRSKFVQWPEWW